jgi:hypothetical protein
MVKFCLKCKNAFWGGLFCPICGKDEELLDAALEENQKYLTELNIDVRPKYFARSAMLMASFGFVMALPMGAFLYLRGMAYSPNLYLWASAGIATVVIITWGTWIISHKIFDKKMEGVDTKDKEPQLD